MKNRVLTACIDTDINFQELALAKCDYHGVPSNWKPEYDNEMTIIKWTKWTLDNREDYKSDIKQIIQNYRKNLIPDYFC